MTLNNIKKMLEIKRIKNLLTLTEYRAEELSKYLDRLLGQLDENSESINKINSENTSEIIPSDTTFLFQKPWNKLPIVHKIIKIQEYCKKINNNKIKCMKMEKDLIKKLKEKKLNNNSIKYDEGKGKIIFINNEQISVNL